MRWFYPLLIFAVLSTGCVSYQGQAYRQLAVSEVAAIDAADAGDEVDPARCEALKKGGEHLSTEGETTAFNGPLGVGPGLEGTAHAHATQGIACDEVVDRDLDGDLADRVRAAARRFWLANDAVFGEDTPGVE